VKKWDVFISHASADKVEIAIPLAKLLTAAGLKPWIDRHEIRLGDSLREKIDEGLAESSYGVVILSPAFFGRRWTRQELNGLVAVEEDGTTRILPVWHKITKEQLAAYSPILADRMSVDTSQGLSAVAGSVSPAEKTYIGGPSATHPGLEQLRAELKMAGCHLDFRIKTYDTLAEQAALVDGTYSDRKTASYENSITSYENPITGL